MSLTSRCVGILLAALAVPVLAQDRAVVFTDITVIDATGAPAREHRMVTVRGGKIAAIQGYREGGVPKGAEVVDGRGKFLIPGLWDMHVHPPAEGYLPLFIANGVTGIRVMWGLPEHHQWAERVRKGTLVGPRMVVGSVILDGPKPVYEGMIAVKNAAEGRAAVIQSRKEGAEFIKVYSLLPRDAYFAIADEAKKQHLPFVGHVPISVSLMEASDAGQKSVEHLTGLAMEAAVNGDQVRKGCIEAQKYENGCEAMGVAGDLDPAKADAVYRRLARNHTWQVPTLALVNVSRMRDPELGNDPRLKYMAADSRRALLATREALLRAPPQPGGGPQAAWERNVGQPVREMRRAGVPFLAGTDMPNLFLMPGFSLHDELAMFVRAGFTPMEALQTATRNAAEFFGTLGSAGTVEKGKVADLVVLEASPLADIQNTQKIAGVMLGGRYFARAALDKMLAEVEALANAK